MFIHFVSDVKFSVCVVGRPGYTIRYSLIEYRAMEVQAVWEVFHSY